MAEVALESQTCTHVDHDEFEGSILLKRKCGAGRWQPDLSVLLQSPWYVLLYKCGYVMRRGTASMLLPSGSILWLVLWLVSGGDECIHIPDEIVAHGDGAFWCSVKYLVVFTWCIAQPSKTVYARTATMFPLETKPEINSSQKINKNAFTNSTTL